MESQGIGELFMSDLSGVKIGIFIFLQFMRVLFIILCKIIVLSFGFELFLFLSIMIDGFKQVVVVDLENNNILILN